VYRLEFLQPDGRWTGPYCAEYMTVAAFDIRDRLIAEHTADDPRRPWPDPQIFASNPGRDRYVCGAMSVVGLADWFGQWFEPLLCQGGHLGSYDVPEEAIAVRDGLQVIYMQRQGLLRDRLGKPVLPDLLVCRVHPTKLPHLDSNQGHGD
jgi:hypothetical protein